MKLGINAVLKGKIEENVAIVQVLVPPNAIHGLLPLGSKRKIIERLLDIFLPATVSYELSLRPEEYIYTNQFGNKENPCVLGVNARLTNIARKIIN